MSLWLLIIVLSVTSWPFLFLQFLCERLNRIYQQSLLTVEEEEREKKEKGGTIAVQLGFKRPRKNERGGSGRERE